MHIPGIVLAFIGETHCNVCDADMADRTDYEPMIDTSADIDIAHHVVVCYPCMKSADKLRRQRKVKTVAYRHSIALA